MGYYKNALSHQMKRFNPNLKLFIDQMVRKIVLFFYLKNQRSYSFVTCHCLSKIYTEIQVTAFVITDRNKNKYKMDDQFTSS